MEVLVIGAGSIGERRAKILESMGHEVQRADIEPERATITMEDAARPWDAVLVCTSAQAHLVSAQWAAEWTDAIFVEKPLGLSLYDCDLFAELSAEFRTSMGACNMRFDERFMALAKDEGEPRIVHARMGQHERFWSPDHQPLSMILDSIHELDLVLTILGPVIQAHGWSSTDAAEVRTNHQGGQGFVILDRRANPPVRYVQLDDGEPVHLWPPDEQMYVREMQHFMTCAEKGWATCNPLKRAADTTRIAVEITLWQ